MLTGRSKYGETSVRLFSRCLTNRILTGNISAPILFYKPKMALIGPEALITVPKAAQPVEKHVPDWEVELTVVIGKPCKDVSESEALDYVLGYVTGNDVSLKFLILSGDIFSHFQ